MNELRPSASSHAREALHARYARRIAACLNENAATVSGDIAERLRFAREQAVERARAARQQAATASLGVTRGGAALLGGGWWVKVASVVPLVALIGGLVLIQHSQTRAQISTAAEVDAALLSDDLPPAAYSDAGFIEFLKTPPRE
jgi:hypothetical protein